MLISIAPTGGIPAGDAAAPTATSAPIYRIATTSEPGGQMVYLGEGNVYNADASQPAVSAGAPVLLDRTPNNNFAVIGAAGWTSSMTALRMSQQAGLRNI